MIELCLRAAGDHAILEILSLGLSFVFAPQVDVPAPLVARMVHIQGWFGTWFGRRLSLRLFLWD